MDPSQYAHTQKCYLFPALQKKKKKSKHMYGVIGKVLVAAAIIWKPLFGDQEARSTVSKFIRHDTNS